MPTVGRGCGSVTLLRAVSSMGGLGVPFSALAPWTVPVLTLFVVALRPVRLVCPIRALRWYLRMTSTYPLRDPCPLLFRPYAGPAAWTPPPPPGLAVPCDGPTPWTPKPSAPQMPVRGVCAPFHYTCTTAVLVPGCRTPDACFQRPPPVPGEVGFTRLEAVLQYVTSGGVLWRIALGLASAVHTSSSDVHWTRCGASCASWQFGPPLVWRLPA